MKKIIIRLAVTLMVILGFAWNASARDAKALVTVDDAKAAVERAIKGEFLTEDDGWHLASWVVVTELVAAHGQCRVYPKTSHAELFLLPMLGFKNPPKVSELQLIVVRNTTAANTDPSESPLLWPEYYRDIARVYLVHDKGRWTVNCDKIVKAWNALIHAAIRNPNLEPWHDLLAKRPMFRVVPPNDKRAVNWYKNLRAEDVLGTEPWMSSGFIIPDGPGLRLYTN